MQIFIRYKQRKVNFTVRQTPLFFEKVPVSLAKTSLIMYNGIMYKFPREGKNI